MENTLVPWTTEYYPNDVADTRHGCEKVYFLLNSLDDLSDAPKGSTALAHALRNNNINTTDLLHWNNHQLQTGPYLRWTRPRSERHQLDADSLLRLACENGDVQKVQLALDRGAKIDGASKNNLQGGPYDPPLCIAVAQNHASVASYLLERKAKVMKPNLLKLTPLVIAVQHNFLESAKVLLSKKAKTSKKSPGGYTPLMVACSRGYEEMVRVLLKSGSSLEIATKEGQTALVMSCQNGHVEIVKLLLLREVDVSCALREQNKPTKKLPIHFACINGEMLNVREILKRTIKNDEDNYLSLEFSMLKEHMLTCTKMEGCSPLCLAAMKGHAKAVALLLELEGLVQRMVELRDEKKHRTPLMWAARNGHLLVVKLLLSRGNANVLTRDVDGLDAVTLAADFGQVDIIRAFDRHKVLKKRMKEENNLARSRGNDSRGSSC
tara:strand:- start:4 stop:1314 length:1311 start_codon:yes stop_codon:yes gene_type:complete